MPHPAQRYRAPGPEPARLRRSVFTGPCHEPSAGRSAGDTCAVVLLAVITTGRNAPKKAPTESRLGLWWASGDLDNRDDIPRERVYRGISSFTARLRCATSTGNECRPAPGGARRARIPQASPSRRPHSAGGRSQDRQIQPAHKQRQRARSTPTLGGHRLRMCRASARPAVSPSPTPPRHRTACEPSPDRARECPRCQPTTDPPGEP